MLLLVGAGALLAYLGVTGLVDRTALLAREVNAAGRQRVIVQRVGLLAHLLSEENSDVEARSIELDRALDLLEESHEALRDGGMVPSLDADDHGVLRVGEAPGRVHAILSDDPYHLDARMRGFVATGRTLADRGGRIASDDPGLQRFMEDLEGPFFGAVDAAVHAYEEEINVAARESQLLTAGAVGTFVLLLTAGLSLSARRRRRVETQRMVEAARRESEAWFRAAAEGSFDPLSIQRAVRDEAGEIVDFEYLDVNARFAEVLHRTRTAIIGLTMSELLPTVAAAGFVERYARVMAEGAAADQEVHFERSDGRPIWYRVQIVPVNDGVAVTSRDITDRKQRDEELARRAHHDALTGLPNRAALVERLDYVLSATAEPSVALLFIDLDRFKGVNDAFGHAAGDEVLCAVAERLRACVRSGDIAARIGGDEFVVLCERVRSQGEAEEVAARVVEALGEPFMLAAGEANIGGSVGIAVARAGCTTESILRRADVAVYEAKRMGGSRFVLGPSGPVEPGVGAGRRR